jgi:hypothetical protein
MKTLECRVHIKMHPLDFGKFESVAQACGMTMSDVMRRCLDIASPTLMASVKAIKPSTRRKQVAG